MTKTRPEPASRTDPKKDGVLENIAAHALPIEEVRALVGADIDAGLSETEAQRRLQRFGANRLVSRPPKSVWVILVAQFKSLIVLLLAFAASFSFVLGEIVEGLAVIAVLAINATLGFVSELRAVRSMESLRRLSQSFATVRRAGVLHRMDADQLVVGDLVELEAGDLVPADLRLVEVEDLQCDESLLTGESLPVGKDIIAVSTDTPIAERIGMAYRGTAVTRGAGRGLVISTGMATELGAIARLTESAEGELSPLEQRLDRLGGQLIWATLAVTTLVGLLGVMAGHDVVQMIKTATALAVAAIPEGLPIVATLALARGMWRMARRNVLIKSLSAVETLGATTVIFTDKTGTLTENRMSAVRLETAAGPRDLPLAGDGGELVQQALRIAVLCNGATLGAPKENGSGTADIGDPMEIALLNAGARAGLAQPDLIRETPEVRRVPFDQHTRMMATFNGQNANLQVSVKGAPEPVIAVATELLTREGPIPLDEKGRQDWLAVASDMTKSGLRVLALASKTADTSEDEPYAGLMLVGLLGLQDPPRPGVDAAISACREAGVRVIMITGDHKGTARAISTEVGLASADDEAIDASDLQEIDEIGDAGRERVLSCPVFARVGPKTKLDLVSFYQREGEVVAMTGDGVNDAPALKKADIGIAMGKRGTDVAREAADMVLRDDSFASIVVAMEQGRIIYRNIRQFVLYLMSCNLSEIAVIGGATVAGLPLPLLPLQILFLNLVTDVFPAFALGVGEGQANVMRHPPRDPGEPILDRGRWLAIVLYAALITAAVLGAFLLARWMPGISEESAVTIAFVTLGLAQLCHVFNMRAAGSGLLRNEVTRNPFVWLAIALSVALIVSTVYISPLAAALGTTQLSMSAWTIAVSASLIPLLFGQLALEIVRRRVSTAHAG